MKNTKKLVSLLLVSVLVIAAFAVSIGAETKIAYAGQGDNALDIAEMIDEYNGDGIIRAFHAFGNSDIAADADNGATGITIGKTHGASGGDALLGDAPEGSTEDEAAKYTGIPAVTNIYTGKTSTTAYAFNQGGCTMTNSKDGSTAGSYWSFNIGTANSFELGLVTEFDIYVGLKEDGTADLSAKGFCFGFFDGGSASSPNYHQKICIKAGEVGKWTVNGVGSFDAGKWSHITLVYTPTVGETKGTHEVYVGDDVTGRELVLSLTSWKAGTSYTSDVEPYHWRFTPGSSNVEDVKGCGSVYMDNFMAYNGTKIHNPYSVKNMTESEAYALFMNAIIDESIEESLRVSAYFSVSDNQSTVDAIAKDPEADPAFKAAYNNYIAFVSDQGNVDSLIYAAKRMNTDEFVRLTGVAVDLNVYGVTRTLTNIEDRIAACNKAEEYLKSVESLILTDSDEYIAANVSLGQIKTDCEMDANVNAFVSAVKIFYENYAAGFVSPLQGCYDEATRLYSGLPLVNAYKPAEEATEAYAKALEDYKNIATDLETLTSVSAAKRFVRIVGMLCDAMESEGGLLADSKYERMWSSAFEAWKLSKYDPTVEGVEDAIERFIAEGGPHEFFWSRLQQEHIDLLTAKLACFENPEATYIDKASACKYVQFYVEQNAMFIDEDNVQVLELVEMADDYRESLPALESEYREFLLANTEKFMAAVEEMESLKDYASIKAKVEAAKEFYYAMEIVGGEDGDTMRYILKYEALEDWLKDVEADCDVYIEVANKLESITDDGQLYLELVRGYACKDMLDDSYEGIVDAKAKYEAVCESVDEKSSAINEEAYQTVDAMCAVRAGVFSEILDFLRNLFD